MIHKALIFFAARHGQMASLNEGLLDLTRQLFDQLPGDRQSATAMVSKEEDPLRFSGAPVRAYDATIDLRLESDRSPEALISAIAGFGDRVEDMVHADLSAALIGVDRVFVASEPTPIRYQYLMRRRADCSHADYLKHYAEIHSQFGKETAGIGGYVQFHVDPGLSKKAAASAGFGIWSIDSVSELHIASMDDFLAAIGSSDIGAKAAADEELFVDRPNSVMFTSDEIVRLGDRDQK